MLCSSGSSGGKIASVIFPVLVAAAANNLLVFAAAVQEIFNLKL